MHINEKLIEEGYINVQKHPIYPYYLYNYTHKCQFEKYWNEQTIICRGLILDEEGNIIARPLKKFFNLEEYGRDSKLGELPQYKECEVLEKMDGSLGICFWNEYTNMWEIATRGSFTSSQAIKANEMLKKYDTSKLKKGITYLFEIIY